MVDITTTRAFNLIECKFGVVVIVIGEYFPRIVIY